MVFRIDSTGGEDKWNVGNSETPKTEETKPKIEVFGPKYKEVYTKDGKNQLMILVEDNGSNPFEILNKLQDDFAKNNPSSQAGANESSEDLPPELQEAFNRKNIELPLNEEDEASDVSNTPNAKGKTPAPKDDPEIELDPPKINLPEPQKPESSGAASGRINTVPDNIDAGKPVEYTPAPSEYNAENPHPKSGTKTTGENGYSMVVQDDGSYKYYNPDGQEISAEEFRKYNHNMYSTSLSQNWGPMDPKDGTRKRGNVVVSDYNYQLIKTYGDPALFYITENGKYVNSKGEVINEYVYKQLCEAYQDITT